MAMACSWQSPQSEEAYACTDTVVVALLAATAATAASKNTALRMVITRETTIEDVGSKGSKTTGGRAGFRALSSSSSSRKFYW